MAVYQMTAKVVGNAAIPDSAKKQITVKLPTFAAPDGTPLVFNIAVANTSDFVVGSTVYMVVATAASDLTTIGGAVTIKKNSKED